MATNKQKFIDEIEGLKGQLTQDAVSYFENVIKQKKVNKKEQEKSAVMREAILKFLQENAGKKFDRVQIGEALYDDANLPEGYLLNEKDQIAFNSITAFANQLVSDGLIKKEEIKEKGSKSPKVKYSV